MRESRFKSVYAAQAKDIVHRSASSKHWGQKDDGSSLSCCWASGERAERLLMLHETTRRPFFRDSRSSKKAKVKSCRETAGYHLEMMLKKRTIELLQKTTELLLIHLLRALLLLLILRKFLAVQMRSYSGSSCLMPALVLFFNAAHLCMQVNAHSEDSDVPMDLETKSDESEIFKTEHLTMGETEERRMSDLSNFSCVSSSIDLQLSTLAEEQGLYNLRKECEEKDAIIKELNAAAYESSIADSNRISELEEIIRRKNMIIAKLKKDMVVLEQKIMQLTRQKRSSSASNTESKTLPSMSTNILYDMSSSSPSSSDSDTPIQPKERQQEVSVEILSQAPTKSLGYSNVSANKRMKSRSVSPAKASHSTPRADSAGAFKSKRLVSSGDAKRPRRYSQQESNCVASQKRWV